jgi:hypothetical protein
VAAATAVMLGALSAQGATGQSGSFCSILTSEEVAAAIGAPPTQVSGTDTSCEWAPDAPVDIFKLGATYRVASIDGSGDRVSSGTELEVAGNDAYFSDYLTQLSIDLPEGGSLALWLSASQRALETKLEDLKAMLTGLGVTVLPRLAGLSLPTPLAPPTAAPLGSPAPQPSLFPDTELEAMFPAELAGETVSAQSVRGDVLAAQVDPSNPDQQAGLDAINQALGDQGKALTDVSFASATGNFGSIIAVRVRGGDAEAVATAVLGMFGSLSDEHQTPATVGGKEVTHLTSGPPAATFDPSQRGYYRYANGDVVWVVNASEPALTEVFEKLP